MSLAAAAASRQRHGVAAMAWQSIETQIYGSGGV